MRGLVRGLFALALGLVLALPGSAHAADELGLSNDGNTWNGALTPLFDSSVRWVPGDTRAADFYARNQSGDDADFRVRLVPEIRDLYDTGRLEMLARADGGDWTAIGSDWTSPEVLAAGDSTRIEIQATLLPAADNSTQALSFSFDVGVQLTYTGPDTTPTPTTPTPTTPSEPTGGAGDENDSNDEAQPAEGSLAGTGADYPAWLLPAGFGALITGLLLAFVARRRNDDEESELP